MRLGVGTVAHRAARHGRRASSIHGCGDSLWWAFTTVSTVGYGDSYPVTTAGRLVAAALMTVGVSLFGVVTASLATYFLRNVRQTDQDTTENELAARLDRVERLLEQPVGHSATTDAPPRAAVATPS